MTVTFNSRTALVDHWEQPPTGVRWVVVDNDSSDDTLQVAESLGAEVVRLEANIGFSAANNRGLALATSEYVAFVNPDVTVDWGTLDQLADDIERQGALIAPMLKNPNGSLQPNARGLPYLVDKLAHRGLRLPGHRLDLYTPEMTDGLNAVAWVMGAALCGSRRTLNQLGGWNDVFFIYYEDHEIGLRAWTRGVPVLVDSRAGWVHGWARATKKFDLAAWKCEVASAFKFYKRYPELLSVRRGSVQRKPYARNLANWQQRL